MKRSLAVASVLFCLSSSALVAGDYSKDWFVGGEFGGQNTKLKITGNSVDYVNGVLSTDPRDNGPINFSPSLKSTYEAIKFGKYFDYGRVYISLGKENGDTWKINGEQLKYSSLNLGIGYDYLFKNKSEFTPFMGVSVGYTKGKFDGSLGDQLHLDNVKGITYGANIGTLYSLSKSLDLEIGARYLKHNIDKSFNGSYYEFDGVDTFSGTSTGKIKVDNSIQYYLGLNYNF